jgi:hypothetical protein
MSRTSCNFTAIIGRVLKTNSGSNTRSVNRNFPYFSCVNNSAEYAALSPLIISELLVYSS